MLAASQQMHTRGLNILTGSVSRKFLSSADTWRFARATFWRRHGQGSFCMILTGQSMRILPGKERVF
jgi:hypothetical protein